jgi:hypothetical protein
MQPCVVVSAYMLTVLPATALLLLSTIYPFTINVFASKAVCKKQQKARKAVCIIVFIGQGFTAD